MIRVMCDLETLGVSSNAPILSIGAVVFDADTGVISDHFYRAVDPESSVAAGAVMDVSTVMWWLKQGDAARAAVTNKAGTAHISAALRDFAEWYPSANTQFWANGPDFDAVILTNAYRAAGMAPPWKFWNQRCFRTLKGEFPEVAYAGPETPHHAMYDAKAQAAHAIKLLRLIRGNIK